MNRTINAIKEINHFTAPVKMVQDSGIHVLSARQILLARSLRLDYCNVLYSGLPMSTISRLQRVQNAAARLALGLSPREHVQPGLKELHWLPVTHRIQFKLTLLMFLGPDLQNIIRQSYDKVMTITEVMTNHTTDAIYKKSYDKVKINL